IDFGGLDDLEIEDYKTPGNESAAGEDIDASALFGDDVEDFEMPDSSVQKKKEPFKPLPPEDDDAILKPDIFTDDSNVTKENPPYYAAAPYGETPKQAESAGGAQPIPPLEEASADETGIEKLSDFGDLSSPDELAPAGDISSPDELSAPEDFSMPDDIAAADDLAPADGLSAADDFSMPDDLSMAEPLEDISFDAPAEEAPLQEAAAAAEKTSGFDDPFAQSDKDFAGGGAIDLNMDLPDEISEVPAEVSGLDLSSGAGAAEGEASSDDGALADLGGDLGGDAFDLPEGDISFDAPIEEAPSTEEPSAQEEPASDEPVSEEPSAQDAGGMDFEMPDMDFGEGSSQEISADAVEAPSGDADIFNTDGMDMASFDMPDSFGSDDAAPQEDGALPGETIGETDEATASALGDFNIQDTDSQLSKAGDDFALEGAGDDFSIPGFSEEGADPYANEGKKGGVDQVDFSGAVTGDGSKRTALTEEEYQKFKKNLRDYPLNVRIAVEDMIAKNEFTDEVVFEVIEKILKKVTARQLANHLEKMLDISLPVPRDYERRSAEEYEAYKASFAYQLKSRILPAIIIGVLAAMVLFCLGFLGHRYIITPLTAEKLYKEGYALIEHDEFPLSKDKFNEALKYKSKKKWFFRYARAYRSKKQYDLAELFYTNILKRFDHDKDAGLEYAQMEV
ncbi:MAG: hypothetical protein IJL24_01175, partial [Treponema sp.]|nr:hypothetical protein [Treponema sp.]